MKKISTIIIAAAAAALALTSCEDKKGNGKLDPSAKVYINAAQMPQSASSITRADGDAQVRLTPIEVIRRADRLFTNNWRMTVDDWNRDTTSIRFIVSGSWVIAQNGDLSLNFISARNYLFTTIDPKEGSVIDTIAYIPNTTIIEAEQAIKVAYEAENYAECYRLFENSFAFIPITGAEYEILKQNGEL